MKNISFSLLFMLFSVSITLACDCEDEYITTELDAALVFEGTVKKITLVEDGSVLEVTFSVLKAGEAQTQTIYTNSDPYTCGFDFEYGQSYIVFAEYNASGTYPGKRGTYYTTSCSFTMNLADWDSLLEEGF